MVSKIFKVSSASEAGDNWMIASLGMDAADGQNYFITTDHVRASELWRYSGGAKADAELIVKLLNEHWQLESTNGK